MNVLKIFVLTIIFLTIGNRCYSQQIIDSLKDELKHSSPEEQIKILNTIADYSLDYSIPEAREYANKAIELSRKYKNLVEEAYSNKILGYSWYYESDYDKALDFFNRALQLYQKAEYKKGISDIYTAMGGIYNKKGDIQGALDLYKKSVQIDEELKNFTDKAITYNSIGMIYLNINDYSKALEYFEDAVEIFKIEKDEDGLANVYANIGNLYYDWGKYEEALTYYDHALNLFSKKGIKHKIAGLLSNKGMVYESMGEYEKGYELLEEALKINEDIGNKYGIFNSKGNIANIKEKEGQPDEALKIYYEIVKISEEINYTEGVVSTYNHIGRLEKDLKNYDHSIYYLSKALALSLPSGMLKESMIAYQNLAELYHTTGNFSKSSGYYKSYIELKDSIFKEESLRLITEFNTKYELEKKEGEINLLSARNDLQVLELDKQKSQKLYMGAIIILILIIGVLAFFRVINQKRINVILESKNNELLVLNTTKDKFFSIIAHDIKNPLSAFRSITESLSDNINSIKKEELESYLNSLKQSSKNLYSLLQNLLEWAMSQTGTLIYRPVQFDLKELIDKNLRLFSTSASEKDIRILNGLKNETSVYADEKMIDTVIRNVLANAIKFSKSGGTVELYATENQNNIQLSVKDSGIGMNQKDIEKLFRIDTDTSTIGNSPEKGTGLGLILCKELAEKNKGSIFASGETGKGMTFTIELPVN